MKTLIIAIIIGLIPSSVIGCSCVSENFTPSEYINAAETIFAGLAIKTELVKGEGIKTTFEVLRTFKGITKTTEVVISSHPGNCNISYEVGRSHVVLTSMNNEVNLCSGYDEYYPAKYDNSGRIDVVFHGILKELRKNDKHNQTSKKTQNKNSAF